LVLDLGNCLQERGEGLGSKLVDFFKVHAGTITRPSIAWIFVKQADEAIAYPL